ncbi:hypothetical protein ACSBR1_039659 [Camellia fascicularis]
MGPTGIVYKAEIQRPHSIVAVKKLWRSDVDVETGDDLFGEVNLLGRLWHRNIVRLLGYLHNENDVMMVYEYMPNGNLGEALLGENSMKMLVDWVSRYNIAVDFEARIADFGLARTMVQKNETVSMVAGSYEYIAPDRALQSLGQTEHFKSLSQSEHFKSLGQTEHFKSLGQTEHFKSLSQSEHFNSLSQPEHFKSLGQTEHCKASARPSTSKASASLSTSKASARPSTSKASARPSTSKASASLSTSKASASRSTSKASASRSTSKASASRSTSKASARLSTAKPQPV